MAGGSADRDGLRPDNKVGDSGPLVPDDESLMAMDSLSLPAGFSAEAGPDILALDRRRAEDPDAPRLCRVVVDGETELPRG